MAGIAHTPVMLGEVLDFLRPPSADALMLDCTLGEGGHAEAFLARYPEIRYVGIDADPRIQAKARERLAAYGSRMGFLSGYFDEVLADWQCLDLRLGEGAGPGSGASPGEGAEAPGRGGPGKGIGGGGVPRPSLILFDLGISMFHFVESGRGFGYQKDEELDMRLSPDAPRSAAQILSQEREEEIARIIYEYGEERLSRRIAAAIVEARRSGGVRTTGELAELVWNAVPPAYRHGKTHPATRTFQALRIAVNDELGRAERGIREAVSILAPGGLVGVISFHSLEDRIAKNVFRELAGRGPEAQAFRRPPVLELVTKKPVEPGADEVARNPASRSAKLRVARKLDEAGEAA